MFENLTEKILVVLRQLNGQARLTEEVLDEICRELRTNLLDADVNVKVVKDFIQTLRTKALGVRITQSLTPEQQFIRIVYEELAQIMGGKAAPLEFKTRPPAFVFVVGLQGSGKTTTLSKLALHIHKKMHKRVAAASVDIYRPAAIEQLKKQLESQPVDVLDNSELRSVRERAIAIQDDAIRSNAEVVLIDTAGRLHIDEKLMEELKDLDAIFQPVETLLVVDGMTGQDAVNIASSFQDKLALTGVVLTKMDGDSRGGAALSIRAVTGCPIKFIGVGEKIQDLEIFHPDRLASRILDMGDLLSLAEKAQTTLSTESTLSIAKKAKKNEFTLADFYQHLQQIRKMGSFENLLKFLPGMGQVSKQLKNMAPPDTEIKKIEAIILSMTPTERVDYQVIDGSRRRRIAKGSGTQVEDVNRLLKQFLEARKMMSRLSNSPMGKNRRLW